MYIIVPLLKHLPMDPVQLYTLHGKHTIYRIIRRGDIPVVVHISTLCQYQNIRWLCCTVCVLISTGVNVHGIHRSAIFSKSFFCENLGINIGVNG